MIGREKMRFGPGALKPARDTVVVSVYWGNENSYRIALIRRSDAAAAFVDIPQELRGEFARFDRDMVLLRAGELGIAVAWALPDIEFRSDWEFAKLALRDGSTPSELGSIRRFGALGVGVDLGELEVADRALLM
ncbi:MAG: hypothetical protein ACLP4V_28780 [Methylocella sp.]